MPKQKVKELPPGVYKDGGIEITGRASNNNHVDAYASSAKKMRYSVIYLCCLTEGIISHSWAENRIKKKQNNCPKCSKKKENRTKKENRAKKEKKKAENDSNVLLWPTWAVPNMIVRKRNNAWHPR